MKNNVERAAMELLAAINCNMEPSQDEYGNDTQSVKRRFIGGEIEELANALGVDYKIREVKGEDE